MVDYQFVVVISRESHVHQFSKVVQGNDTYRFRQHTCWLVVGSHVPESNDACNRQLSNVVTLQINLFVALRNGGFNGQWYCCSAIRVDNYLKNLGFAYNWNVISELPEQASWPENVIATWGCNIILRFSKTLGNQRLSFRLPKDGASLMVTIMPDADRRVSRYSGLSESTNASISKQDRAKKKLDLDFVLNTNLITRFAKIRCPLAGWCNCFDKMDTANEVCGLV